MAVASMIHAPRHGGGSGFRRWLLLRLRVAGGMISASKKRSPAGVVCVIIVSVFWSLFARCREKKNDL